VEARGHRPSDGASVAHRRGRTRHLDGHGDGQRAVLVYQIESYCYWRDDFVHGKFGENFTLDDLADDDKDRAVLLLSDP